MKPVWKAMPFMEYLAIQDPTGALTAKVYAGVHRVFKSMGGDPSFEDTYQSDWESDPVPMSAAAVIDYLGRIQYAPTRSESMYGCFSEYDYRNGPTIRITTHQWPDDNRVDTILHETAHAVQSVLQGYTDHGPQWVRMATLLGCKDASEFVEDEAAILFFEAGIDGLLA